MNLIFSSHPVHNSTIDISKMFDRFERREKEVAGHFISFSVYCIIDELYEARINAK